MNVPIPNVDWELDQSYDWPAYKFGMEREDLFGVLHEKYNAVKVPLQEWRAFHSDVNDVGHEAENCDEFLRLLDKRMDERRGELQRAQAEIFSKLLGSPRLLHGNWRPATNYIAKKSIDSLLELFAHLAGQGVAPVLDHGPETPKSICDNPIEPKPSESPQLTSSPLRSKSKPRTKRNISRRPRSRLEKAKPRNVATPARVVKPNARRYNLRPRQSTA